MVAFLARSEVPPHIALECATRAAGGQRILRRGTLFKRDSTEIASPRPLLYSGVSNDNPVRSALGADNIDPIELDAAN
jgi:hypothetical protein